MLRREFFRRMMFAALATWFLDLPLPRRVALDPDGWTVHFGDVVFQPETDFIDAPEGIAAGIDRGEKGWYRIWRSHRTGGTHAGASVWVRRDPAWIEPMLSATELSLGDGSALVSGKGTFRDLTASASASGLRTPSEMRALLG